MRNLKTETKTPPNHRKRDKVYGYQRQDLGEGKLEEGSQKVQTSSYKIIKYQRHNVHYHYS